MIYNLENNKVSKFSTLQVSSSGWNTNNVWRNHSRTHREENSWIQRQNYRTGELFPNEMDLNMIWKSYNIIMIMNSISLQIRFLQRSTQGWDFSRSSRNVGTYLPELILESALHPSSMTSLNILNSSSWRTIFPRLHSEETFLEVSHTFITLNDIIWVKFMKTIFIFHQDAWYVVCIVMDDLGINRIWPAEKIKFEQIKNVITEHETLRQWSGKN